MICMISRERYPSLFLCMSFYQDVSRHQASSREHHYLLFGDSEIILVLRIKHIFLVWKDPRSMNARRESPCSNSSLVASTPRKTPMTCKNIGLAMPRTQSSPLFIRSGINLQASVKEESSHGNSSDEQLCGSWEVLAIPPTASILLFGSYFSFE